ncbi:FkbM family methyltransferase [Candidatus Pelagibacter bacterium nBUS_49]|uniref:FkbM family methyltransferase n=1 Tax=Candidatus Pelagibacter bacterium nBUS_49 TaxID=3374196 RepID=UPI003EBC30C5
MKKYLTKILKNEYKLLFKALNSSTKSSFRIDSLNLTLNNNTPLGEKNEKLILPLDEIITPRIFKNEQWDYFIIKFIKKNIKYKNNYFFDIGANVGLISRQLQKLDLNIKNYFCFEPEKNNFNILSKNLINKKTYLYNFGLASKNKKTKIFVNKLNKSDNSIYLNNYVGTKNNLSKIILKDSNIVFKKIIDDKKINHIIYKSDTQGMDEEIFLNLDYEILDKIYLLILEISNFKFISKNLDKFLNKLENFRFISTENQSDITLGELKKLIFKKEEFNLLAKK